MTHRLFTDRNANSWYFDNAVVVKPRVITLKTHLSEILGVSKDFADYFDENFAETTVYDWIDEGNHGLSETSWLSILSNNRGFKEYERYLKDIQTINRALKQAGLINEYAF